MDFEFVTSADWNWIFAAVGNLFLFAGLAVVGALSFLAGSALVPSLVLTRDWTPRAGLFRWGAYGVALLAFALALVSLGQALILAVAVISRVYPRWLI